MSVWHCECVRVDGELMAAVRIQDDWTGNVRTTLRKIHLDPKTDHYWFSSEGQHVDATELRERFLREEDKIKEALKWYKQTNWRS